MSRYTQGYSFLHNYSDSSSAAITLPVTIISGRADYIDVAGVSDTGSSFCVFERRNADLLDLDLYSGTKQKFSTAAGTFTAYGHEVIIQLFDYQWEATVYFHESDAFPRNILGRAGFID